MQFPLPCRIARRIPDPSQVFDGLERHILFPRVRDVPRGIPLDPNARATNIHRRIYRQIEESLLDRQDAHPGTFHLKHKGITVLAQSVKKLGPNDAGEDVYSITIGDGEGIVDGGHSYELIVGCEEELPEDQYVKIEVLTRVPPVWIPAIAGGLNTSVQVHDMSLENLKKKFEWIKEELKGEPYFDLIAWRQNESGKELDARDVIALMTCFNIELFPNDGENQPVQAYEKKKSCLDFFTKDPTSYRRVRPILKDILTLHDTIRYEARDIWNKKTGGKFGKFAFVDNKKHGKFKFPFIDKESDSRMMNGALYPMLGAFRWMVEEDDSGDFRWKGDFENVLALWRTLAHELIRTTEGTSNELGRNANAIGKSRNHWAQLHRTIAMRQLLAHQAGPSS